MKKTCLVLLLLSFIFLQSALFGEEERQVRINFAGLDLATIARQVERVTKRSFLADENLLRSKRVTLQSETPIGPEEFYRVFQAVCQMNGLAIVPVEGAGISLEKIVQAQGAFKEPGFHPVLVQGDAIPGNEALVSFLAKLKNATPTKIMAALTPVLSPTGSLIQVPNSDLLLINDVASSIKRAERMLTLLDVPGEAVVSRAVRISNLSVERAQAMLTEYLQALSKAATGEAGRERVSFIRDERLNTLHLLGAEQDVARAQDFLKSVDLDMPATRRQIRYYKLRNVPVHDIVDYVAQLLGLALAARTGDLSMPPPAVADSQAGPVSGQPHFTPSGPPATGPGIVPPVLQATSPPVSGRAGPAARPAPAAMAAAAATTRSPASLPAEIIPVEGLNTLVVAGDETVHKEVGAILQNLDQRKGQVLIEVAIVQVTGDGTLDFGVEVLKLNNAYNDRQSDVGTGFGLGTQSDPEGRGFPSTTTVGGFTGAAYRFVSENRLEVILRALAAKSNVSIVSQPLLLVNDNEQASFTTKVSEPTVTTSQGTATTNTSFAGFADATTALKITPHISPDGYLNLQINQTFEEFTGSSGNGIPPPKISNDADTKVTIPDRQTIIIGGFTRDASTATKAGVPGLMNIPGLGKLFSRENTRKTISRLYLFVRPRILSTAGFEDLQEVSGGKKDDVEDLSRKSKIRKEIKERIGREGGLGRKAEVVPDPVEEKGK